MELLELDNEEIAYGQKALNRKLSAITEQAKNWKPQFTKIGEHLVKFYSGPVFRTEGRAIQRPWKKGPYYHKLQRTGMMRKSFYFRSKRKELTVYNPTPYFRYHQSLLPRYRLPRRPMMRINRKLRQYIIGVFTKALKKRLKK